MVVVLYCVGGRYGTVLSTMSVLAMALMRRVSASISSTRWVQASMSTVGHHWQGLDRQAMHPPLPSSNSSNASVWVRTDFDDEIRLG